MSSKLIGEANLKDMDIMVRDMCDDLDPKYITKGNARYMRDELRDISDNLDKYCNDNRSFLLVYASELTKLEVTLWQHELQSLKDVVKNV